MAHGRQQVGLVHGHAAEPPLPEMAGLLLPGVDMSKIAWNLSP